MFKVEFISIEDDDKDLILSFVIPAKETGVRSLILLRTLLYEGFLPEYERGVKVSLEGDVYDEQDYNMLSKIDISGNKIRIYSTYREYILDVSRVDEGEISKATKLLKKQNYDNRFTLQIA